MHGPGYAPPHRPSTGGQVTLRVIFVAMAVLSCGFVAWACMLRLAAVTKRPRDWILFALSMVHLAAVIGLILSDPGKEEFTTWRGNAAVSLLLAGLIVIVIYYLYAEIRHFSPTRPAYAQTTGYSQPQPQPNYGYPAPQPYTTATSPSATPIPSTTPTPLPQLPVQQGPQRPAPARIDQVRAELDELSDYLRKQEGDR